MLILSRHVDESIVIGSGPDKITVTVVEVWGNRVRLGLEAPKHIPIDRAEIRKRKEAGLEPQG